jgi:hypothetical protein
MADSTTAKAKDLLTVRSRARRGALAAGASNGRRDFDRLAVSHSSAAMPEESLVVDGRSAVTPAPMVESKLKALLQRASLPASYLPMRGLVRAGR